MFRQVPAGCGRRRWRGPRSRRPGPRAGTPRARPCRPGPGHTPAAGPSHTCGGGPRCSPDDAAPARHVPWPETLMESAPRRGSRAPGWGHRGPGSGLPRPRRLRDRARPFRRTPPAHAARKAFLTPSRPASTAGPWSAWRIRTEAVPPTLHSRSAHMPPTQSRTSAGQIAPAATRPAASWPPPPQRNRQRGAPSRPPAGPPSQPHLPAPPGTHPPGPAADPRHPGPGPRHPAAGPRPPCPDQPPGEAQQPAKERRRRWRPTSSQLQRDPYPQHATGL